MPELIHLLAQYPILEALSHVLPLGGLLALSRTDSVYRAVLRGLPVVEPDARRIDSSDVREDVEVGYANTRLWVLLKQHAPKVCAEQNHTKGDDPRPCQICSMPVCAACVVKSSFKKNEYTFITRRRGLCGQCWTQNKPHRERLRYLGDRPVQLLYAKMEMCRCTAKDGVLCTPCRDRLQSHREDLCAGIGCSQRLNGYHDPDDIAGRVCVWCDRALPGSRSKERSWSDYESRRDGLKGKAVETTTEDNRQRVKERDRAHEIEDKSGEKGKNGKGNEKDHSKDKRVHEESGQPFLGSHGGIDNQRSCGTRLEPTIHGFSSSLHDPRPALSPASSSEDSFSTTYGELSSSPNSGCSSKNPQKRTKGTTPKWFCKRDKDVLEGREPSEESAELLPTNVLTLSDDASLAFNLPNLMLGSSEESRNDCQDLDETSSILSR